MELHKIIEMPTTFKNIHESCFRSYHILKKVLYMIERGDSQQTIFEVVEFLSEHGEESETDK